MNGNEKSVLTSLRQMKRSPVRDFLSFVWVMGLYPLTAPEVTPSTMKR